MYKFWLEMLGVLSFLFSLIPESLYNICRLFNNNLSDTWNALINRLVLLFASWALISIGHVIYLKKRKKVYINNEHYSICVMYGDILDIKEGKKVISFDECFTTTIGNEKYEIKENSICGQYLRKVSVEKVREVIKNSDLQPSGKSKYNNQDSYTTGKIIQNGDDLLLAFSKLDSEGLARESYEDYLETLRILWEEIEKYYAGKDVYIPLLGSGFTRIQGRPLNKQEILDLIINSYKLSLHKIKKPSKLYIVCPENSKEKENISLNEIGKAI